MVVGRGGDSEGITHRPEDTTENNREYSEVVARDLYETAGKSSLVIRDL